MDSGNAALFVRPPCQRNRPERKWLWKRGPFDPFSQGSEETLGCWRHRRRYPLGVRLV